MYKLQILRKIPLLHIVMTIVLLCSMLGRAQTAYAVCEVSDDIEDESRPTVPAIIAKPACVEATARITLSIHSKDKTDELDFSDLIWMDWTRFESGDESWWQAGGDGGNAYGRYQFDKRYWLGEFLKYCAEADTAYAGLAAYANEDGTVRDDGTLDEAWEWICHTKQEDFFRLQTDFALDEYYYVVKADLLELYQIDIDEYGPILRGTVWSIAIRDGVNVSLSAKSNRLKSVSETYYPEIDEAEWLERIYAREAERHTTDPERWSEDQKETALSAYQALQDNQQDEIDLEMLSESTREFLSW